MKKIILAIILLVALVMVAGCSVQKIADIKNEDMVGKTVRVEGKVDSSFKLGSLSGFSVKDGSDKIGVLAQNLPKEGETVTVKGTLMKDTILGYYIKADE